MSIRSVDVRIDPRLESATIADSTDEIKVCEKDGRSFCLVTYSFFFTRARCYR